MDMYYLFPQSSFPPCSSSTGLTELTLTVSGNESSTEQRDAGLKEGAGKRMDDEEDDNRWKREGEEFGVSKIGVILPCLV